MSILLGMAKGVLNTATGGLLNKAFQSGEDARQYEKQKEYQDLQIKGAKEMTTFNQEAALGMKRAEYKAAREGIENAGLNAALMYGQGGAGGMTVPNGQMPSGGNAGDANQAIGNNIQLGMLTAQQDLIQAQTEKTKAEAEQIAGAGTDNITADTANKKLQNDLMKIQANIGNRTIDQVVQQIWSATQEAAGRAMEAVNRGIIARDSANDQINQIKTDAANAIIQGMAMKQDIKLSQAKITEISQSISQKWQELNLQSSKNNYEHRDRLKAIEDYTENALYVAGIHATGQLIGDMVKVFTKLPTPKGSSTNTTTYKWGNETRTQSTTTPNY